MPSFLKTKKDEKMWEDAKKKVEEQHGTVEGKWALVNHIYQNMKKHKKSADVNFMGNTMARRNRLTSRYRIAELIEEDQWDAEEGDDEYFVDDDDDEGMGMEDVQAFQFKKPKKRRGLRRKQDPQTRRDERLRKKKERRDPTVKRREKAYSKFYRKQKRASGEMALLLDLMRLADDNDKIRPHISPIIDKTAARLGLLDDKKDFSAHWENDVSPALLKSKAINTLARMMKARIETYNDDNTVVMLDGPKATMHIALEDPEGGKVAIASGPEEYFYRMSGDAEKDIISISKMAFNISK